MSTKWTYQFDELERAEWHVGGEWDRVLALLGGKGANLGEMTSLGLPVPPGFTVISPRFAPLPPSNASKCYLPASD